MRTATATILATLFLTASAGAAEPDLSGRWSGYWVSDKNGHTGPLRASFRRVSDTCYRVTFSGRFWKVVPFVYSVRLAVTGTTGDVVTLAGETRAGPVIGTFHYDAVATPCHFEARFTSRNDSGRFVLTRGR